MASNAAGTATDYGILLVAANVLELPTPVSTALGVCGGAIVAFLLNRGFVFAGDGRKHWWPQAARYAFAIGTLMVVHTWVAWFLRDGLELPLLVAKVSADVCVFAIPLPFVLRRFVFRAPHVGAPPASQPIH